MKTLTDINLCSHPNASKCFFYMFLGYKAEGMVIQLPTGHPACPCDHCVWLHRTENFFTSKEGDDNDQIPVSS